MTRLGTTATSVGRIVSRVIPTDLFLPGWPYRQTSVLSVESLPIDAAGLSRAKNLGRSLRLVLSPQLALSRSLVLPEAAAAYAAQAIDLQLRQSMPAKAQGLIWSQAEVGRLDGKVQFLVQIAKEALILQAIRDLAQVGSEVLSVHVGESKSPPVWRRETERTTSPLAWVLLSALIALVLAAGKTYSLHQEAVDLETVGAAAMLRVVALEKRLKDSEVLATKAVARLQEVELSAARFRLERQRLTVMTDLSILLPDEVWVSELTIAAENLTISGFSMLDVPSIVEVVQTAPWAKSVMLDSAVTQDPYSGQSRFSLAVELQFAEGAP